MANALTVAAATAATAIAGVGAGKNSNGQNSVAMTFANGATGAADTVANAALLAVMDARSRIYEFFNTAFATQATLDATAAALGLVASVNSGSLLYILSAAPGKPTLSLTTAAAVGTIRFAIAAPITA